MGNVFMMFDLHFDKLPVWSSGNAYFNGAKPYKNEINPYVDAEEKAIFSIDENGHIDTNLPDLLKGKNVFLISSDTLGKAFEPEQRYEKPDGSDIIFDTDYFGSKRRENIIPGPFDTLQL